MRHTRFIQTTVTLAALMVGSACAAETSSPDTAIGAVDAVSLGRAPLDAATTTLPTSPTPNAVPHVDLGPVEAEAPSTTVTVEMPAPPAAPEPEPAEELDPELEPVPGPAAEPAPEPESEPAAEPPGGPDPADPVVFETVDLDIEVDRKHPTPVVSRPDLGLAFAPCGAFGPLADTASAVTTVMVDAVADGTADDAFTSYLDGGDWSLRLTTSGGTISEYDVAGVGPGFVESLGAAQFDAAQGDEFLAVVGSGASNLLIGAFGADEKGCIVRFTDTAGSDVEFQVGGSVGQLNGVACSEWNGMSYVESLGATDMGGGSYNVYGTSWHKVGVSELESENGTHMFGVGFEEAEIVAQLDCPGITL